MSCGKTLKELNVKPGDRVRYSDGTEYTVLPNKRLKWEDDVNYTYQWDNVPKFSIVYRVKPEPVLETVTLYTSSKHDYDTHKVNYGEDTHRITFETKDGEPVCDSIKMEKL